MYRLSVGIVFREEASFFSCSCNAKRAEAPRGRSGFVAK
jgi:hypothetical protein